MPLFHKFEPGAVRKGAALGGTLQKIHHHSDRGKVGPFSVLPFGSCLQTFRYEDLWKAFVCELYGTWSTGSLVDGWHLRTDFLPFMQRNSNI